MLEQVTSIFSSLVEFSTNYKDVLSLIVVPIIIPFGKWMFGAIKNVLYSQKILINKDTENILSYFTSLKFDELKNEQNVIQNLTLHKVSYFKGYSIEKVDKLLKAQIGNNDIFTFFELNKLGYISDTGKISDKGKKLIGKSLYLKILWLVWAVFGTLMIIYIQFIADGERNIVLFLSSILLLLTEMLLLHWGDRINRIKRFSFESKSTKKYQIEINGNSYLVSVRETDV